MGYCIPCIDNPVGLPPIADNIEIAISTIPSIKRTSFKLYSFDLTNIIAITNAIRLQTIPNSRVLNRMILNFYS